MSMSFRDKAAILLVLTAVALVYVQAVWLVTSEVIARRNNQPVPASRVLVRWVFVLLAVAGLAAGAYGYFVEPRRLEVSHVRIGCDKLPPGSPPVRIAHLSDVHSEPATLLERRLVHEVARFKPDLVAFTGDAANVPGGLPNFRQLLTDLAKIAPVYGVAGNWDLAEGWADRMFDDTGAHRLMGQTATITTRAGQRVVLAGADPGDHKQLGEAVRQLSGEDLTVFLYHYPAGIADLPAGKADLMLSGHIHGGQVAIPGYGAIITLSATGKQYERGLYRVGNTHLYVSRGIGTEGGALAGIRLFSRPELVLIELVPVDSAPAEAPALAPAK